MTYKKTCGTCRFFDDDPTKKHPDCDGACHPPYRPLFNFCPHCGARVVMGHE